MNILQQAIIKKQLSMIPSYEITIPWNNSSIISGNDSASYFAKRIDPKIIKETSSSIQSIDIKKITGICHVSIDTEYEDIISFDQIINDNKGKNLINNINAIDAFKENLVNRINIIDYNTWSQNIFIYLSNGNHRFSILRRNSIQNNTELLLQSKFAVSEIDIQYLKMLDNNYSFYIVSEETKNRLIDLDIKYRNKFCSFIKYPVNKYYLCISKNSIGIYIGNYIENNNRAINIIKDIKKCLTTAST